MNGGGRQTTNRELRERLDFVEKTLEESGWSGRICRGLADHFGVSVQMVRHYKRRVLADLAEARKRTPTEQEVEQFLCKVRSAQADAKKDGRHGPLLGMLSLEADVLGVKSARRTELTGASGGPIEVVKAAEWSTDD